MELQAALRDVPLIGILRGLDPDQAVDTADILVDAGFRILEVPMNSPDPLLSIERIANKFGDAVVIGAGTVLTDNDVASVASAGGKIIVSPNMKPSVGEAAASHGLHWCPGVMTPTEAFSALDYGAAVLKLFPAEMVTPKAVAAVRAVLPAEAILAAVGGIVPEGMTDYHAAGCDAFGLGSGLFKPDYSFDDIAMRARRFVESASRLRVKQ